MVAIGTFLLVGRCQLELTQTITCGSRDDQCRGRRQHVRCALDGLPQHQLPGTGARPFPPPSLRRLSADVAGLSRLQFVDDIVTVSYDESTSDQALLSYVRKLGILVRLPRPATKRLIFNSHF